MISNIAELSLLLIAVMSLSAASLSSDSDQLTAIVGDVVTISCHHQTPVPGADWVRVSPGQSSETELCLILVCLNDYAARFSVDRQNNYRLTIRNVTINDTGKYACIVYDDFEQRYTTRLTVIDRPTDATTQDDDRTAKILAIAVAAVLAVTVAMIAVLAYVACRRDNACLRCSGYRKDEHFNGVSVAHRRSSLQMAEQLPVGTVIVSDGSTSALVGSHRLTPYADADDNYTSAKQSDAHKDWLENEYLKEPYPDKTFSSIVMVKDGILMDKSFLYVFRLYRNNTSKHSSAECAAESFTTLAGICKLWWARLSQKSGALRRIRRHVHYECSGYGKRAIRMEPLKSVTNNSPAMAVAILDGTVYIVFNDSNNIEIGSDRNRRIVVPGMKYPVDMVACNFIQGLYIADEQQQCIWRIGADKTADKWNELVGLTPISLSTRAGSLLITTKSNIIVKYSQSGKVQLKMLLPLKPDHVVETRSGTFIASCKSMNCNQLVEFGYNGDELRRFVCVAPLLRFPSYMILDHDEQLLVADYANSRILLLDTKLEHACTILDHWRHRVEAPHRMCLNEQTGQLFVAQWPSSSVDVYGVKLSTWHA